MERIRMAALAQGDDKLQLPMINNLGNEVWKCKEAKLPAAEDTPTGRSGKTRRFDGGGRRGGLSDERLEFLIMRHPESIRLVKSYIDLVYDGGTATDVARSTNTR